MKISTISNRMYGWLAFVVLAALALYACKTPFEDVGLTVNTDIYSSPVLIRFVNAKGTGTTQPTDFSVKVSGKDAGIVVMAAGGTDYKATGGVMVLALDTKNVPSSSNPITFTVSAEIPGFTPVTQPVTITGTDPMEFQVQAVEYANPAEGTSALVQQTTLTGNATPEESIVTPKTSDMTESTKISLNAGTQFLDASGGVLAGSQLESRVVHYGTGTDNSIHSFPGGFVAPNVIGPDGNAVNGGVIFQTAGFLAIDMFVGGKEVKSFSKPIAVSMDLNNSLVNPSTGVSVKAGESIPVWSLNEETGQWKYESTASVTLGTDGKLKANFNVTHLSAWNVDWWGVKTCTTPLTMTINMPNPAAEKVYWVEILDERGQYLSGLYASTSWSAGVKLYNGYKTTIPTLPDTKVKFVVFNQRGYDKVTETELFNPCGKGAITVTINPPSVPNKIDVNFAMSAKCSNKNVNIDYSGFVSIYKQSETIKNAINAYVTQGKMSVSLENNVPYVIVVPYNGKNYTTTFTPSSTTSTTNFPTGNTISGSYAYDAATKTLKVQGIVSISCN